MAKKIAGAASPWRAAVDSVELFLRSRRRRAHRTIVLTALLLLLSSCLNDGGVMAHTVNSAYDLHISDQSRHDLPGKGTGDVSEFVQMFQWL